MTLHDTQQSEEKYAHLLQPIRDLAGNWSIDIANELEDYLEVLEGVQFSFADGGPSLNFAEAALLIQGSACIYSKKVEYLHTLVYQALEFIAERRKRDARSGTEGGVEAGGGGGGTDIDEFDDEEQFLSLDDTLEEGAGIDLGDEAAAAAMPAALRPPTALLALEDTGNSRGDGDAGNYRIASCVMHRSGALLLEQRDSNMLGDDLQPVSSEVGGGAAPPCWGPTDSGAAGAVQSSGQQAQHEWGGDAGLGGGFEDDGGDDGFGGDDYDYDHYQQDPDSNGLPAPGNAGSMEDAMRPRQGGALAQEEPPEEEFDPYKPLDPNSRGTLKSKPFKKAAKVSRRIRAGQQQGQQRQRAPVVLDTLLSVQAPAAGVALLFPEFSYALQQEAALSKASRQAASSRAASSQRSAHTTAAAFTYEEAVAGFQQDHEEQEEDDAGDFYAGGGGFDNDDYGGEEEEEFLPQLADTGVQDLAALAAVEWDGGAGADGSYNAGDHDGDLTYEELCRAHIEAFISAAAAAEVQSELAARVSGWRSKMAPALEEEAERPEFDIHAYGDNILARMEELTCPGGGVSAEEMRRGKLAPVKFSQVVGVRPKYEVSRTFSSMLQLINNGNVRITKLSGGDEGFTLTLLDRVLPHNKAARGGPEAERGSSKAAVGQQMQGGEELDENLGGSGAMGPKAKKAAQAAANIKAKRQKG